MLAMPEAGELFFTADPSQRINKSGQVARDFRYYLEGVFEALEQDGRYQVFSPLREAGWQTEVENPALSSREDLDAIERSVGVIALIGKNESPHIYTELGYGMACGKVSIVAFTSGVRIEEMHPPLTKLPKYHKTLAGEAEELAVSIRYYVEL